MGETQGLEQLMGFINREFKARCADPERIRALLSERGARYEGCDHQVDTYFRGVRGRLKLREGSIEHALIHYQRPDDASAKTSQVILYQPQPDPALKEALTAALGVLVVVDKQRHIYFEDNVKIHVDDVQDLGSFLEVEAIQADASTTEARLQQQCDAYAALLGVAHDDYLSTSYSDMLLDEMRRKQ